MSDREKILKFSDELNKDALWLVNKILQKHSAAILEEVRDQLKARDATITELTGLLRVAKCPCCDGSGAYYDNMGEVCQCQWCDETKAALKESE